MMDLDKLDFEKNGGIVSVICQDAVSGEVLMLANADRAALDRTIETGEMHYLSRTRGPWHKGATSGNVQKVVALLPDCDGDAVLARVNPAGPACHEGTTSCFGEAGVAGDVIGELDAIIRGRASAEGDGAPASYTRRLLADRNLRLKKLGEEAAELVTACADEDRERAAEEAADVIYHALVALHAVGGSLQDVRRVLASRSGAGGRR